MVAALNQLVNLTHLEIATGQRDGVDEVTENDAYLRAAEFLVRQRFRVAVSEKLKDEEPIVQATVGACRILVVKARPEGSDRDQIRRQATAAGSHQAHAGTDPQRLSP
jgi:hypothetical protein